MSKPTKLTVQRLKQIKVVQARLNYLCTEEDCRKLIPKGRKHYSWISRTFNETYFRACSVSCLNKLNKRFDGLVFHHIKDDYAKPKNLKESYPKSRKDVIRI